MTSIQIKNKGEKQFAELLEKQAIKFVHQPKPLQFKNLKYTPDFYLPMTNQYIEVVGTPQAYSYNKKKIKLFQSQFQIKCVYPNGDSWDKRPKFQKRLTIKDRGYTIRFIRRDKTVRGYKYFRVPPIRKDWQEELNWLNAQQGVFELKLDKRNRQVILRMAK